MKECICCYEVEPHTASTDSLTVFCCDRCFEAGCTERKCFKKRAGCPVCRRDSTMCGHWPDEVAS